MGQAEVITFSESWRRVTKQPPDPAEISVVPTDINAFRYRRERAVVERRAMRSLLPAGQRDE